MKNYLRALRHAWPYRRRLLLSIFCAFCAAVLWGLNFTSIYPVLKLLHTGESLHQWVDARIASHQKEIEGWQSRVDALAEREKELEKAPSTRTVERQKRELTAEIVRLEAKLQAARVALYWYQVARKYIVSLLPDDCFLTLVYICGIVFTGIAVKCLFEFFHESLVGSVVNLSLFDLRNRFFRNAVHLDIGQFNEHGTTELMARFTNDMESLAAGMKMLFGRVVAEPLRVISCITIACLISWQLTLMFLVLVPFAALVLVRVSRLMKRASRRVLERMSSIYKILQEVFQGIRVVKLSSAEAHERRRFREATRDYYRRSMMVIRIEALADPIIEVLSVLAVVLAVLVGSYLVLTKHTHLFGLRMTDAPLEPESMLQLYILMAAIADPVRKLSSVLTRLQAANAASDRIFDFIDRQPRVAANHDGVGLQRPAWLPPPGEAPPAAAPVLPLHKPYIELRDVCFSYEPRAPILSHINLAVRPGETIALVGHNGCGKTTLAGLLARFFDPDHGSVLIDGVDLREAQLRSLRRLLSMVTQDTFLFDDTIYNNITYGCPGATREQVEAAARQAFAHDFITALPAGYESRVGERGALLSGGQKQRLALARALLRDPAILILDEFTSQNDVESEAGIHAALKEFIKHGRTVFVITHRLNTLEIADRIVVLEEGRIVAVGTHAELIATCGVYQRLHEAQGQRMCA